MRDLFSDINQCQEVASDIFKNYWIEAQVTVVKLDGSQFFIN